MVFKIMNLHIKQRMAAPTWFPPSTLTKTIELPRECNIVSGMEKPRKGGMYVYNMATGAKMKPDTATPTTVGPASNQPTILKKVISKGWGQLTRSRTYREEIGHHRHDGVDEVINNKVEEKKIVVDHGRKPAASSGTSSRRSVSQIEEIKMVQGRKSVCSISELTSSRKSASNGVEVVKVASKAASFDVKIFVTDMPGFMQVHAFKCARNTFDSLEKFSSRDMACTIKKEFDKVYGPAWHCIVGSSFGSYVTHSTGCFLYFSMEKLYILVFKTKVKRASE